MKTFNWYKGEQLIAEIKADFSAKEVSVTNYTDKILDRPFGIKENPSWSDFEKFLESRCVPRTRNHIKWYLESIGVQNYVPLDIIHKTKGHMEEDQFLLIDTEYDYDEEEVKDDSIDR